MEYSNTSEKLATKIEQILEEMRTISGPVPSLRSLAKRFSVSHSTVRRALEILSARGVVTQNADNGRYYRTYQLESDHHPDQQLHGCRADAVAEEIMERICAHPATELPFRSISDVAHNLHCSWKTARTAVVMLERRGIVRNTGKRLRTSEDNPLRPGTSARVSLVISEGSTSDELAMRLIRGIESTLSWANWGSLRYVLEGSGRSGGLSDEVSAGLIVVPPVKRITLREILNHPEIPCILVNRDEQNTSFRNAPHVVSIGIDNRYAGSRVAQHLILNGHKRVVFLGMEEPKPGWTRQRLEGAAPWFSGPGRSIEYLFPSQHYQNPLSSHPRPPVHSVVTQLMPLSQWRSLPPLVRWNLFLRPGYRIRELARMTEVMKPVFEAARNKNATGWICSNDYLALTAMAYLRQNTKNASSVEVFGFDNLHIGAAYGLTTFDFAYEEIGRAAVRLLMKPFAAGSAQKGVKLIRGSLNVRNP